MSWSASLFLPSQFAHYSSPCRPSPSQLSLAFCHFSLFFHTSPIPSQDGTKGVRRTTVPNSTCSFVFYSWPYLPLSFLHSQFLLFVVHSFFSSCMVSKVCAHYLAWSTRYVWNFEWSQCSWQYTGRPCKKMGAHQVQGMDSAGSLLYCVELLWFWDGVHSGSAERNSGSHSGSNWKSHCSWGFGLYVAACEVAACEGKRRASLSNARLPAVFNTDSLGGFCLFGLALCTICNIFPFGTFTFSTLPFPTDCSRVSW